MARMEGDNWDWGFMMLYTGIGLALLVLFVIGLLILLWGILNYSVLSIILGIITMIAPAFLLWLSRVLFVDPEHRLVGTYSEIPGDEDRTYTNPYQAPPPRPPMRPEPGTCADCGGKLFLGRESCPHCGAKVHGLS